MKNNELEENCPEYYNRIKKKYGKTVEVGDISWGLARFEPKSCIMENGHAYIHKNGQWYDVTDPENVFKVAMEFNDGTQ